MKSALLEDFADFVVVGGLDDRRGLDGASEHVGGFSDGVAGGVGALSSSSSSVISVVSSPNALVVAASVMMTETLLVGSDATSNRLPRNTGMAFAMRRTSSLPEEVTARMYLAISSMMTMVGLTAERLLDGAGARGGAVAVVGFHRGECVVTDLGGHLAPQRERAVPVGVDASGGVEGVTDEGGDLHGAVREQGGVEELGDVGGSRALGEVVDGGEAVGLTATEGGGGAQHTVLPGDALRSGDTSERLGQERLEATGGVGLREERVGVAVDRVVVGVAYDLVQLRCEVVVRESARVRRRAGRNRAQCHQAPRCVMYRSSHHFGYPCCPYPYRLVSRLLAPTDRTWDRRPVRPD